MKIYQCLLFVVPEKIGQNLEDIDNRSTLNCFKRFAVLPSFFIENCPQICELFDRINIEILNNQQCLPLQHALKNDQVKILELNIMERGPKNIPGSTSFFCISVETGNEEIVRLLFGQHVAVYKGNYCSSDIWKAVDEKNFESVEHILTCTPDIGLRNLFAGTLLHLAVKRDDENLVKLLLKHNANVNAQRSDLSTPLHLAAQNGNKNIANFLIEKGASINARKKDGSTSLLLTVGQGCLEIVRLLLKNGADVSIGKHDGLTPLHIAAKNGHAKIVNDLLEHGAIVNATMTYCSTKSIAPLCLATEGGHSKIVKSLLEYGADVNVAIYDNQTVLQLAVDDGCVEIVECILEQRLNLNNKINKRVLYKSVCRNGEKYDKIVKILLQYGFTIDVEDIIDSEFLHKAICKNYFRIVEQFLDYGADVNKLYRYFDNANSCFQKTVPLLTAVKFGKLDMVKLLVKRGADINAKLDLNNVSTIVDEAIENDNFKAVKVLFDNKADFRCNDGDGECEDIIYFAIEHNCLELVEELLKRGAIVSGSSLRSTTPIVYAAGHGTQEVIQLLLQFGASIDSRDEKGWTSLHTAACEDSNRLSMVKFLIQNNADIEARCFGLGETPIFLAVTAGNLKIVDELLKFEASIDCTNNDGMSPLHYAVIYGQRKVFRAFLDHNFTNIELIKKTNICKLFSVSYVRERLYVSFNRFREGFKKSAEILARHVIKTKAAFSSCPAQKSSNVSDYENLMAVLKDENLLPFWYRNEISRNNFLTDCETEIAQLKTQLVGSTSASFYDILTEDVKNLACFARNTSIVETINSKVYKIKFPIYAGVIFYRFRQGTRRRKLLNRGVKMFRLLCSQFNELPRNLKEEVLNYLSNKDLEILAYTCTYSN